MNPSFADTRPTAAALSATVIASLLLAMSCGAANLDSAEPKKGETAESAASPPAAPARGPELAVALEAAQTALAHCRSQGFSVSASVVDSAGILKVLLAADGATPRGVQSSTNKAVTAVTFKANTSQLGERLKRDKSFAETLGANPNYNVHAGAVLLTVNGEVIGALGVGGGHPSEVDEACANAAVTHVRDRLK